MVASDHPSMSDYERKAWETLLDDIANRSAEQGRFGRLANTAKSQAKDVALKAKNGIVDKVPAAEKAFDAVDDSIQKAMAGLHTAFVERGLNSVSAGAIFKTFAFEGSDLSSYDSIRELDLRVCDRTVPRRKEKYIALAAGQGAATSLAVTGATVSSTVSGGTTLGVAAGAIVVDVTAVMVGMGRIVALVAAHYGYDVREPDEQLFAAGVLSYSSAGSAAEKAASLAALSRLTQDMMRRATWKQLQQHQLVNVIQTVVTSLGFNLTKKKLAQAVPVAGAVINGGLNARLAQNTFNRAQSAYRLRFLTEKYGLDASQWAPEVVNSESTQAPLIDAIVESELATNSVDGGSPSGQRHPSDVGGGGIEGGK
ncbi:EcsC family protein [Mycolicibacterium sp.]|uniref:EcsC family protein n=1 Tax=Mycolicibacterium sp. TaxID=2320850 RepID=UPI0037C97708